MAFKKEFCIGVDFGNFGTKTSDVNTPSGCIIQPDTGNPPSLSGANEEDYILYKGNYIIAASEPTREQGCDRTATDLMFNMTLLAIAKQMYITYKAQYFGDESMIRQAVEAVKIVHMGFGLPPVDMQLKAAQYNDYYKKKFGEGVEFDYMGIHYAFALGETTVQPQCYAALGTANAKADSVLSRSMYNALDWGGYTLDIISIYEHKPDLAHMTSRKKSGVYDCAGDIRTKLARTEYGEVPFKVILSFLRGEGCDDEPELAKLISRYAEEWTHEQLNKLINENGIDFATIGSVFMGGTALMLRPYIESFLASLPRCAAVEFFDSPNMNAEAYRIYIKTKVKKIKEANKGTLEKGA